MVRGGQVVTPNRDDLIKKVRLIQRFEVWKNGSDNMHSKSKGPEVGSCILCLKKNRDARVAGAD